jgi:quinol monooxygenase YgiN
VATRLVISCHRHLPAILRSTETLWPQLRGSDGLLGYSLNDDLTHRTLNTVSAWRDHDALRTFVTSEAHALIVAGTRPWIATTTILTWTTREQHLPVTWQQVREHLRRHDRHQHP